jgi:DNA polymerase III delta prime subunit
VDSAAEAIPLPFVYYGVDMINDDFLWVEKYRPSTVSETILPSDLKSTFQKFVDQNNIPNLILDGSQGVGKTTIAKAMLEELGCDYIIINGSLNGNIDTLRNEIMNFASSISLMGGRKYVILDEADYLNANSTQPALRNFMEEFSKNCGFILTCNFLNRLIKPLHSRCSVIHFKIAKKDMPKLASQFFERTKTILEAESVEYDPKVVAEVITKHFPDWRRVLNELQRYSAAGKIDSGILANLQEVSLKELVNHMKEKNFTEVRKWIGQNSDNDQVSIYRNFYDNASMYFKTHSIPQLILVLGKYQYQAAFSADPEINLASAMVEVMCECEFQ